MTEQVDEIDSEKSESKGWKIVCIMAIHMRESFYVLHYISLFFFLYSFLSPCLQERNEIKKYKEKKRKEKNRNINYVQNNKN